MEGRLKAVEKEAVGDYIAEAENLADLHRQIAECDGVLENIESILTGFQTDLNSVTADIRVLQVYCGLEWIFSLLIERIESFS